MDRNRLREIEETLLNRICEANEKGEGYCLAPHQDIHWFNGLQRLHLKRKIIRWVNGGPQRGCWLK